MMYVCNECDEMHEDKTTNCEICGGETREVDEGDLF